MRNTGPDTGAAWRRALLRGDFQAAWAISDGVLAARDPASRDDPLLPYHQRWVWDGRPFDGRDVLVRCYHGLGDTLQFARYLPAMRRRAKSLRLEAPPALVPLLEALLAPGCTIAFDPANPTPASQCDLEIMELAHALRIPPEDAGPVPYLPAPAHAPLPGGDMWDGICAGLCWAAGNWAPERSAPLDLLLPVFMRPGLRLVSLQRGPDLAENAHPLAFINPGDRSPDILRTAALIRALDLVVTVDTMVAHLAGALGRPTWVLLPEPADWRWMADRSDSPWYPSVRLYRQRAPGDWQAPLKDMAADLEGFVASWRSDFHA